MLYALILCLFLINAVGENENIQHGVDAYEIVSRTRLTTAEKAWINHHLPIRILVDSAPPYQMWNNTAQGISVDYLRLICQGYGLECQFINGLSSSDAFEKIEKGIDVDLIPTIVPTAELEKRITFTDNYLVSPWVIFARLNSSLITNMNSLRHKRIAVVQGLDIIKRLKKNYPEISLTEVLTPKDAIEKLSKGKVDAYIEALTVGVYLINQQGYNTITMVAPTPFGNHVQAMGARPDWPELVTLINRFLANMTPEEHVAITNRWLATDYEENLNWGNVGSLISVVVFLVLVVAIVMFMNHHLKKEIRKRAAAELEVRRSYELLHCIDELREQFIKDDDPAALFSVLLEHLLQLTGSQYGLIGDILIDDDGERYLKTYALSNQAWDEETRKFYAKSQLQGFEFRNLDNILLGLAINSGQVVITNEANKDPRAPGFPHGHPKILSFLGIPVYYGERLVGEVCLANRAVGFDLSIAEWIAPIISALGQIIAARWEREARLEAESKLIHLAITDPLTKVANRNQFIAYLKKLTTRIKRYPEPLTLLMLDIDHFKLVNDNFGHEAGDQILIDMVQLIDTVIRQVDLLARWGGEEFLILLPNSDMEAGRQLAERIRSRIEEHSFKQPEHITVSLGVTSLRKNDTQKSFIDRADQALYKAKHAGRNRVEWL